MSDNKEYIMVHTFKDGSMGNKLVEVKEEPVVPTVYYGFKSTTSSEIIYVSFDVVPANADNAYVISNISSEHNIINSEAVQKLLRYGETNNFVRISDSSFSLAVSGTGEVTYERISNTQFLYQSEAPVEEANKQVTFNHWDYVEPIEITPSSGNDVMEKTTVTLNGIVERLSCWKNSQNQFVYSLIDSPDCGFGFQGTSNTTNRSVEVRLLSRSGDGIVVPPYTNVYSRYPDGDIVFRNVDPSELPSWWSNEGVLPNKMMVCVNITESNGFSITGNGSDTIQTLLTNAGHGDIDVQNLTVIYYDAITRYYCTDN